MPDENAGCPMASMITARELKAKKKLYPDAKVVCYVNTTAAVKAESDVCCTSSNAVKIVSSFPEDVEIIFVPDKSLGAYVSSCLDREMMYWEGYCPTHHRILAEQIVKMKSEHPEAKVVVHPECTPDVIALADHVASTTGILKYAKTSTSKEFVIGTEIGILHRMKKENPDKIFMPVTSLSDCPNMKLNTLEKLLWSLEDTQFVVTVSEEIAVKARQAIQRMLGLS
jgi:quinolinate synthase